MKKQNKNGLTLIELMITVVVSSIVILTAASVLILVFQSWRINNAYAEMRRDAALAVYLMARDVRESDMTNIIEATTGRLELSAHPPARNNAVTYTKTADRLASDSFGLIIPRGLQTFSAQTNSPGDGVYLTIGMTNFAYGIAMTNQVFVNTRN